MNFLHELNNFDYKQVDIETYEKVRCFLIEEKIDTEKVKEVSHAAYNLYIWLLMTTKKIQIKLHSIEMMNE